MAKKEKNATKSFLLTLDMDLYDRIEKHSRATGTSVSQTIRNFIQDGFRRFGNDAKNPDPDLMKILAKLDEAANQIVSAFKIKTAGDEAAPAPPVQSTPPAPQESAAKPAAACCSSCTSPCSCSPAASDDITWGNVPDCTEEISKEDLEIAAQINNDPSFDDI